MTTLESTTAQAGELAARLAPWPMGGQAEIDLVTKVIESGRWWRVQGSQVSRFEREFATYTGFESVQAVTNGTHALELALQVLGVGPGDEVIVPAFTFVSTAMAAQRLGAVVRFGDVDLETYCLLPSEVERLAGPRTKVVIPVHMAGHPADMDGIRDAAGRAGVAILQDAAHGQGTVYDGRLLGELGSPAIYSFQNGKLMTAGEGGAVALPAGVDPEPYFLRHNCGRAPSDRTYDHLLPGSNFRLSELQGAVLRAQLERLPDQVATREANIDVFLDAVTSNGPVVAQHRRRSATVVPHYMVMLQIEGPRAADVRRQLVDELARSGLPLFHNYQPVYRIEAMGQRQLIPSLADDCPNTERIWSTGLWLHHRVLLSEPDVVAELGTLVGRVAAELSEAVS